MNSFIRGGIAGAIATVPMTGEMVIARHLGLMEVLPPKEITRRAEQKAGEEVASRAPELFHASWLVAHFGYGAAWGAVYSLVRHVLPGPPPVKGTIFGLALWAGSYYGLLPFLRLYPPPNHERPSQAVSMVVAHVIYGAALGDFACRL